MSPRTLFARSLLATVLLVPALDRILVAQPGSTETDIQELARQVRRNMVQVEREIDRAQAEAARSRGAAVESDLQKIIDSLGGRAAQITKDIDAIIAAIPPCGGGGGGGGGQSSKSSSGDQKSGGKSRDRNRPQNTGQEKGGQRPEGGAEDNTSPNPEEARNRTGPPRRDPTEKVQLERIEGRWGNLPPELRQRLLERNFREFTPEYQEEIRAYYRRIAQPR
jgi:hypothetical protein